MLEDESSRPLLPIMMLLAFASGARGVDVVAPDLTTNRVSARAALRAIGELIGASIRGQRDTAACREDLRELLSAPTVARAKSGSSRVLYVLANLWLGIRAGGSVGHIAGVVNGLLRAGYDVDFVTAAEPVMIASDANVLRLWPGPVGIPLEANYYSLQRDALRTLRATMRPREHRFLYYRLSIASYLGVPLARALDVPLVAEYNGSEVWAARHWGRSLRYESLARLAEEVTLRHADVVVTVSDVLRQELITRGVAPARIAFHPNAIDPAIFTPKRFTDTDRAAIRARTGIATDRIVVTFVGTFGRWHGVELFARAIRALADERAGWLQAHRVHFLLVGDGLLMPEVRSILADRLSGLVSLTGLVPQDETPRYLAISDVLVSPHVPNQDGSAFFGSPTKLFEYMAMGGAIVASDLGQIGDVLQPALRAASLPVRRPDESDREVAILTTPGNIEEFITGICFLVENGDWRLALGRRARERALSRYTWKQHVDTILERLEAVVGLPRES